MEELYSSFVSVLTLDENYGLLMLGVVCLMGDRLFKAVFYVFTNICLLRKRHLEFRTEPEKPVQWNKCDYLRLTRQCLRQRNYWLSLVYGCKAERYFPDKAELHCYLGKAYLKMGMFEGAKKELDLAVSINPRVLNGEACVGLARYYIQKGKKSSAVNYLEQAIDWFPSAKVMCEVGELYQRCGQREKAKEVFRDALIDFRNQVRYKRSREWRWAVVALIRMMGI